MSKYLVRLKAPLFSFQNIFKRILMGIYQKPYLKIFATNANP